MALYLGNKKITTASPAEVVTAVSTHNEDTTAHADIRAALANKLTDSDLNTIRAELAEKLVESDLDNIKTELSEKLTTDDIINNLTSDDTDKALSAAQGKALKGLVDAVVAAGEGEVYTFATGDANGQIKVTPSGGEAQNIDVKGLASAAYTESTDYATSAQGVKADSAVQGIKIGETTHSPNSDGIVEISLEDDTNTTYTFASGDNDGQIKVTPSDTGTAQNIDVKGLKSAAFTEADDYATFEQGGKADTAIQGIIIDGVEQTPDSDNKVEITLPEGVTYTADEETIHIDNNNVISGLYTPITNAEIDEIIAAAKEAAVNGG